MKAKAVLMVIIMLASCLSICLPLSSSVAVAEDADYWALIVCASPGMSFQSNTDYMNYVLTSYYVFDETNTNYLILPDKAQARAGITNWLAGHSDANDIVFIYFSSHGGGYNRDVGNEGGRLDDDGDEGNEIKESAYRMGCWGLNRLYDLDGDGAWDDLVRNLDGDSYIDYDLDNDGTIEGDFRTLIDYDADGNSDDLFIDPDMDDQCDVAIDANVSLTADGEDTDKDGLIIGVDLNSDGDKTDWVGYDEQICIGSEAYWDDELAEDLSTLNYAKLIFVRQGCLDPEAMERARELFLSEGCAAFRGESCFGGGLIDDISASNRIIMTATDETWYSYGDGDGDGFSEWSEVFIDALYGYNCHYSGGEIVVDNPVDADTNNDGHVSMKEAWDYAWDNDDARSYSGPETPWLDDNGNGLPTYIDGADQADATDGILAGDTWLPLGTPGNGTVVGETRDVNANLLSGVEVSLYEYEEGFYGDDVASPDYYIEVDQCGYYWLLASLAEYYDINTTDDIMLPGIAFDIDFTTYSKLAAGYPFDFEGNYGLVPRACELSYVLRSVNLWKVGYPGHPEWGIDEWKVGDVISTWLYPS